MAYMVYGKTSHVPVAKGAHVGEGVWQIEPAPGSTSAPNARPLRGVLIPSNDRFMADIVALAEARR